MQSLAGLPTDQATGSPTEPADTRTVASWIGAAVRRTVGDWRDLKRLAQCSLARASLSCRTSM